MIEADEDAPASPSRSAPTSPSTEPSSPTSFTNTDPFSNPSSFSGISESPLGSPRSNGSGSGSPLGSPGSGGPGGATPWRRGHARQQSLGTTHTSSPSTRRRSLESTISLIKEVVDGSDQADSEEMRDIAESISSPTKTRVSAFFLFFGRARLDVEGRLDRSRRTDERRVSSFLFTSPPASPKPTISPPPPPPMYYTTPTLILVSPSLALKNETTKPTNAFLSFLFTRLFLSLPFLSSSRSTYRFTSLPSKSYLLIPFTYLFVLNPRSSFSLSFSLYLLYRSSRRFPFRYPRPDPCTK